jgi:hypothetical protein
MSVVSVVCCQVEVSATSWPLVQRSPTDCGASLCVWYRNLIYEESNINHLWFNLNTRYITGCISCMPAIVTVKHDCWLSSDWLQCPGGGGMETNYHSQLQSPIYRFIPMRASGILFGACSSRRVRNKIYSLIK